MSDLTSEWCEVWAGLSGLTNDRWGVCPGNPFEPVIISNKRNDTLHLYGRDLLCTKATLACTVISAKITHQSPFRNRTVIRKHVCITCSSNSVTSGRNQKGQTLITSHFASALNTGLTDESPDIWKDSGNLANLGREEEKKRKHCTLNSFPRSKTNWAAWCSPPAASLSRWKRPASSQALKWKNQLHCKNLMRRLATPA